MSADLFTFHEAVSQLQMQEDEVLDTHKALVDAIQRWDQQHRSLLEDTRDVDYDQDGEYCDILLEPHRLVYGIIFMATKPSFRYAASSPIEKESSPSTESLPTPHQQLGPNLA